MENGNRILIYDCTLRDGTQGENVCLSVADKVRIAEKLDSRGFDYIEGGWPGSNPRDREFFEEAKTRKWAHSRIAAFGSTRHWRNPVESDGNLQALLAAETPTVTLVGKSSQFQVTRVLGIGLEQNLEIIGQSVAFMKQHGREVVFDAEHFFDGYRANPDYVLAVLESASEAGADWLVLCDTNGGSLPSLVGEATRRAGEKFDRLGVHTHNDCELAVANTVAAVQSGARMVQGTINGYGERTGNANLTSILPILEFKLGLKAIGRENLEGLTSLAHFVSEVANLALPASLPFVGRSAFAHKGGLHVNAVMKDAASYEHIEPEMVGNRRRVLVSDLSGKSNLKYKVSEQAGTDLEVDWDAVLDTVKRLEYEGYQFDVAEGSFRLLMHRLTAGQAAPFEVRSFRTVVDHRGEDGTLAEATVKLEVGGVEELAAADGRGPVHALDRALKKALVGFFPSIAEVRLTDYKVRVIDEESGTAARVRVLVESSTGTDSWTTVGVSDNIIAASWQALTDSICYNLLFGSSPEERKRKRC